MKVLDSIGMLQLIDIDRRCSVRNLNSAWRKDPGRSKLQHGTMKSLLGPRPPNACLAWNQLDGSGAEQTS